MRQRPGVSHTTRTLCRRSLRQAVWVRDDQGAQVFAVLAHHRGKLDDWADAQRILNVHKQTRVALAAGLLHEIGITSSSMRN